MLRTFDPQLVYHGQKKIWPTFPTKKNPLSLSHETFFFVFTGNSYCCSAHLSFWFYKFATWQDLKKIHMWLLKKYTCNGYVLLKLSGQRSVCNLFSEPCNNNRFLWLTWHPAWFWCSPAFKNVNFLFQRSRSIINFTTFFFQYHYHNRNIFLPPCEKRFIKKVLIESIEAKATATATYFPLHKSVSTLLAAY